MSPDTRAGSYARCRRWRKCPPISSARIRSRISACSSCGRTGRDSFQWRRLPRTGRRRGATQFSLPGALDLLRSLRDAGGTDASEVAVLAATDPANPYGATLKWPASAANTATAPRDGDAATPDSEAVASGGRGPTRSIGATVILVDGALGAYLARGDRQLTAYLPDAEPQRSRVGRAVSRALIERARAGSDSPRGMLIEEIDGGPPAAHTLAPYLAEAGFIGGAMGFQATFRRNA